MSTRSPSTRPDWTYMVAYKCLGELLWDLRTCCYLVCNQTWDHYGNHLRLGSSSSGFCHGLLPSSCQDRHLYETTPGHSDQDWQLQGSYTQPHQEHLSWSEASWKSMEFVPCCQQAHLIGLHHFLNIHLSFLLRGHHLHGMLTMASSLARMTSSSKLLFVRSRDLVWISRTRVTLQITLEWTSRSIEMILTSSPNEPWLTQSFQMSESRTPKPNQFQPKLPCT